MPAHNSNIRQQGFTLMELIMVIVIAGILATMTVGFITKPMEAYVDLSRRAELVDSAEMSMRMMARDIRRALPNSVREITDGFEMINTVEGGRYRDKQDPSDPSTTPLILPGGVEFDVLGNLNNAPDTSDFIVIYNLTNTGNDYNAYNSPGVGIWNRVGIAAGSTTSKITMNEAMGITQGSPRQRFFIVDEVIRYQCTAGVLYRQQCSIAPSPTCGTSAPISKHMDCGSTSFSYQPGTAARAGLVTINLSLISEGERISLLHQVHVDNVP